jgi:hypothetical protein
MSYLRGLCLCAHSGFQHILCLFILLLLLLCLSSSCVPNAASVSGLSIFHCSFCCPPSWLSLDMFRCISKTLHA